MDEPKIIFDPYAAAAQRELVEDIINRRNVRITGHDDDWYPVAFLLKTADGEILGGLLGQIWAQWLYAISRGCANAWLSTHSFQARPLYERLGYRLFGTLEDYPKGHSLFFMTSRSVTVELVRSKWQKAKMCQTRARGWNNRTLREESLVTTFCKAQ
jgi:hypothetical protein